MSDDEPEYNKFQMPKKLEEQFKMLAFHVKKIRSENPDITKRNALDIALKILSLENKT